MNAYELAKRLFPWGPVLFGIGFFAPTIAQLLDQAELAPPFRLTTLQTGLIAGLVLGTVAKLRGRWI